MITARGAIDLDLARGEVVLLRGPNGSGKTSLLRALAGLSSPLPIEASLAGSDPARLPASALRDALALSPQDARDALAGLTVAGEFRLRGRATPAEVGSLADRDSAAVSSGEARRVALALAQGAPLLLLDEPAEGLDAEGRARLRRLVIQAASRGAVVAADHGDALEGLATRIVQLGEAEEGSLPPIPKLSGDIILDAPAIRERGLALPALRLGPGFHALRGPNGSGKSTLLLAAARRGAGRLLLPRARDMLLHERVDEELRGCGADARSLVDGALLPRHPLTLSGGEAQRVALAKTLGRPTRCYLLDEPEAHLSASGRRALVSLLAARVAQGACILAATHDEALASLAQSEVRL